MKMCRPPRLKTLNQRKPHRQLKRRHKKWSLLRETPEELLIREEKKEYIIAGKFAGSARIPALKLITRILNL
jgi:hypothetical protein